MSRKRTNPEKAEKDQEEDAQRLTKKLRYTDLRELSKARNLPCKGKKDELAKRLVENLVQSDDWTDVQDAVRRTEFSFRRPKKLRQIPNKAFSKTVLKKEEALSAAKVPLRRPKLFRKPFPNTVVKEEEETKTTTSVTKKVVEYITLDDSDDLHDPDEDDDNYLEVLRPKEEAETQIECKSQDKQEQRPNQPKPTPKPFPGISLPKVVLDCCAANSITTIEQLQQQDDELLRLIGIDEVNLQHLRHLQGKVDVPPDDMEESPPLDLDGKCHICWEEKAVIAYFPCKQIAACEKCSNKWVDKCPRCNMPSTRARMFF